MSKQTQTPVAVKPAQTTSPTKAPKPATANRPVEKILARVPEMTGEKAVKWLEKTSRTIVNHYDATAKKRKCTEAYWNGLITRYDALSKQAQAQKAWEGYCKSIGKETDHAGVAFIG